MPCFLAPCLLFATSEIMPIRWITRLLKRERERESEMEGEILSYPCEIQYVRERERPR